MGGSLIPRSRRLGVATVLVVLALGLTACLSIKLETTFQRAPGLVSLKFAVCASDYNQSTYATCDDSNVQETDNLRADSDGSGSTLGQLFVGFRVPDGSGGPDTFLSDAQDASFSRSATYTDQLTTLFPPAAGWRWVGYVSTPKTFDPSVSSSRETGGQPEFTLPPQASGEPFAGPFLWRVVAGFRSLTNAGDAGTPIACGTGTTFCADSPPNPSIPTNLEAAVSDFGVLAGNRVTADRATTATVSFPVRYVDGGAMGAQSLAISAKTTVPGGTATPSVTTLNAAPNSTTTVDVNVPVPASAPPGSYTVTLTAVAGTAAVTRSNLATIEVSDKTVAGGTSGTQGGGPTAGSRIVVTLSYSGAYLRRSTRFTRLQVRGVPSGSMVRVACKPPNVRGRPRPCPSKAFTKLNAGGNVSIGSFVRKSFKVGTVIEARVTRAGRIGAVKRLTIRSRKAPSLSTRCLPAGTTKPTKC